MSCFVRRFRVLVSVSAGKPHFGSSRTIYSAGVRVCLEFLFGGCSSKQSPSARGDGPESGSSGKIVATGQVQRQTRGRTTKDRHARDTGQACVAKCCLRYLLSMHPRPPERLVSGDLAALFPLDRSYSFLNHGSFGSVPFEVLEAQRILRMEIEARPIEMLGRKMDGLMAQASACVARFVGVAPERFGFVANATDGVNAVLRSVRWERGDEVIVLDHVYNAMRQSLRRLEHESGVVLREAVVTLPLRSSRAFVDAVVQEITPRTKMLLIDHITSPTALIVPVAEIGAIAAARGIFMLIDGAHAPGSIDLNIDRIPCDAYTANLHKWCCAPKGCAFVTASEHFASQLRPLATSHRYGEGLTREFAWQGTRDMSPFLTAPAALRFFDRFGWDAVRAHNHALAVWTQQFLTQAWGVEPLCPLDGSMLASMAPVALPAAVQARFASEEALQAHLYDAHRIEIPVINWKGRWHVRVSCHLHTTPALIERLREVVSGLA